MASGDCDDDSPFYLYLDDIYDEIEIEEEISTSSTNATAAPGKKRRAADVKEAEGGTKRKRKVLNKTEKTKIMLSLCDVDICSVIKHVKSTIEAEKHMEEVPGRMEFWNALEKSESLMKEIMLSLTSTFASLYLPPGKDVSDVDYDVQKHSELARLQQRWIGFCEGKSVDSDIRCSVMISLCNAVYKYFLNLVSSVQQSLLDDTTSKSTNIEHDSDSVYYRFCGAAIAEMLHGSVKQASSTV